MPCYAFGPFELDSEARLLRREGEPVPLAGKTLDILVVLVENRGRLVDKEELLSRVWAGSVVEEANLTQTIFTVRKILGDNPKDHRYIATVAGRGYQFVAPVTEATTSKPFADEEVVPSRPEPRTFWGENRHFAFWAVGILIITLAAGLLFRRPWNRDRNTGKRSEALQLSRFTSYPGVETMPAFSPDGKQIAFVRAEHDPIGIHSWQRQVGRANIYTKLIGAGTELRLTNHPGADYYPTWSPDGQYLAFYRDEPGRSGLYTISALGGQERRITEKETEISGMAWLSDRHLVLSNFSEVSHSSPLVEISLDTGKERPVTFPPANSMGDAWPGISPDGKRLAFLRYSESATVDVCFTVLAESRLHCLPLQANWAEGLAWTASGDAVIVSAVRTAGHRLWRYELSGGPPVALTTGEGEAVLPAVARQGDYLAYVLSQRTVNLWHVEGGPSRLVNSATAKPIARSTRFQSDPAWAPDGHKVAFESDRSGASEIWVTDTETEALTQLTHFRGPPAGTPSWSPSGRQIAFDSEQSTGTTIFVISADGGVPRRLTANGGDNCVPSWSQDGRYVYFASRRSGDFEIWKVSVATGETPEKPAVQITHGGGFRAFESPDRRYLYYAKGRGKPGLCRLDISNPTGGREEPILASLQHWGWWALAPGVVYFLELPRSLPPRVHLKALDLGRGGIRELFLLRYPVLAGPTALAVSRDGRHLVYTQIDSMEADVMLAEGFR